MTAIIKELYRVQMKLVELSKLESWSISQYGSHVALTEQRDELVNKLMIGTGLKCECGKLELTQKGA